MPSNLFHVPYQVTAISLAGEAAVECSHVADAPWSAYPLNV